jgi:anti-sigma-K factor RskA
MTHEQLIESAAGYALGVLDADERSEFESHLTGCAQCRAEVDSYRETVGLVGTVAPPAVPANSAALRARILERASAARPIASAPSARARQRDSWVPWTAAAASIAIAAFSTWLYASQRDRNTRMQEELTAARNELAARDSALAALMGPEVHVVSLAQATNKPAARVFWNHTRNVFVVTAHALPPAPDGKTYQLWAISKGKPPVSMGTFNPDADGGAIVLPVSTAVNEAGFIDFCALTVEPQGGSSQPTETPRLIGSWRHVD